METTQSTDSDRFAGLYARYAALVLAYLTVTLPTASADRIEDLAQDTWLRVWIALPALAADPAALDLIAVARRALELHQTGSSELPTDMRGERDLPPEPSAERLALAGAGVAA